MASTEKSGLRDVPVRLALLTIVLLSLCFENSYDGDFVFDDSVAIVNNADVKDADLSNVLANDFWGTKLSHKDSHGSYRPLTILSFRFHYWMSGHLDPMDFHLVNILLHTIVCLSMFFVYKILVNERGNGLAFYAASLFAVHPLHAEAVSGIVGRADVLCALFVCLSIISYNCCVRSDKRFSKILSMTLCVVCIAAAILCKEIGITAIGICGFYDVTIVDRLYLVTSMKHCRAWSNWKALWIEKSSLITRLFVLIIVGIAFALLRFSLMGFTTPTFKPIDNPASFVENFFYRAINYNYIYCLNAWLLVCPEWLCFDWSMGCVPLITGFDSRIVGVVVMWIVMGSLIVHAFRARKTDNARYVAMGLVLLIVPFLPASNIFINVGFVIAERTLYLPSAGYCLLVAIGLQNIQNRFPKSKTHLIFYIMLIAVYFGRSWIRSDQWREEKSLFYSALNVCPLNAKVHYNIAKNAADLGDPGLAELEYRMALRLNPDYAQAMNNLGNLLKSQGNYEEAEKILKRALELQNDFATAWMNLGIVLSALGKYNESENSYKTALSHRPHYPDCHYNLGLMFLEVKDHEKAMKAWQMTIVQKSNHRRAWVNWVRLLDDTGKPREALKVAKNALEFIPDDAAIHLNIANILGKEGRFEDAERQFKRALSHDPENPTILTNLGVLYHRWDRLKEAEKLYERALKINPRLKSAKENLMKLISRTRTKKRKKNIT